MINRRCQQLLGLPSELLASQPHFSDIVSWQREAGEFGSGGASTAQASLNVPQKGFPPRHRCPVPASYPMPLRFTSACVRTGRSWRSGIQFLANGGAVRTYADVTERRKGEDGSASLHITMRSPDWQTGSCYTSSLTKRSEQRRRPIRRWRSSPLIWTASRPSTTCWAMPWETYCWLRSAAGFWSSFGPVTPSPEWAEMSSSSYRSARHNLARPRLSPSDWSLGYPSPFYCRVGRLVLAPALDLLCIHVTARRQKNFCAAPTWRCIVPNPKERARSACSRQRWKINSRNAASLSGTCVVPWSKRSWRCTTSRCLRYPSDYWLRGTAALVTPDTPAGYGTGAS